MTDTRTPVGLAEALEAIAVDVMVANRIRRNCAVAATKLREMAAALEPFAELFDGLQRRPKYDALRIAAEGVAAYDEEVRNWEAGIRKCFVDAELLRTARRVLRGEP